MNFQVGLDVMFGLFDKIQELIQNSHIVEISVKQHHINIILKESDICSFSDILSISQDDLIVPDSSYVTLGTDYIVLSIENIPDDVDSIQSNFKEFVQVIRFLADNICRCPALEFVISAHYLKFYLDKPGLKLEDLQKVETLFDNKCTLELGVQRPYLLFINENLF